MNHHRNATGRRGQRNKPRRVGKRLHGELLETRYLLSGVSFTTHKIVASDAADARSVYAADVDGDGDMDVLSASSGNHTIGWYENTDGLGNFGPQQVITTQATGAWSVYAADLDGDGDLDGLLASAADDKIAWYENTDGYGDFSQQRVITTEADAVQSVYAADLDGDGDIDVLSASVADDKITWYENADGLGNFRQRRAITTAADGACSVYAADLDGDGNIDILSASASDDKIVWYQNDGRGNFAAWQVLTAQAAEPMSVYAADVDGDGDLDILSASAGYRNSNIAWFENTDGWGNFGPRQVITTSAQGAKSVYAADLDGDGDIDVLSASASDDKIAWYENIDGLGTFDWPRVITNHADGAGSVYAVDLDGDGDVDVLSASSGDNKIAWYQNTDGLGDFGPQQMITNPLAPNRPMSAYAADLDGDGDVDVLSASSDDNKIAWYENIDHEGNFGPEQVITTQAGGAESVYAADIDGDGDIDVLSASRNDTKTAWYENTDGQGSFGPERVITNSGGRHVRAADLDSDGDVDVLTVFSDSGDNKIAWYANTDGRGTFGPEKVVTTDTNVVKFLSTADMDGDGDVDVVAAISNDVGKIIWYENTDGLGTFGPEHVTTGCPYWLAVPADIDGDGDLDLLSACCWSTDQIAWHENTDGQGTLGTRRLISELADGPLALFPADVDGDGDVDVFSASRDDDTIAWYENTDGQGKFGRQQVITNHANGAVSVFAADVDGDGDVDVFSASSIDDKIAWYENHLLPIPGDANLDGEVDADDLNAVGLNWRGTDKTWARGDFTGDGIVNAEDLNLLALNWRKRVTTPISAAVTLSDRTAEDFGLERLPRAPLSAANRPIIAFGLLEGCPAATVSPSTKMSADKLRTEDERVPSVSSSVSRFAATSTSRIARQHSIRELSSSAPKGLDCDCVDIVLADNDDAPDTHAVRKTDGFIK